MAREAKHPYCEYIPILSPPYLWKQPRVWPSYKNKLSPLKLWATTWVWPICCIVLTNTEDPRSSHFSGFVSLSHDTQDSESPVTKFHTPMLVTRRVTPPTDFRDLFHPGPCLADTFPFQPASKFLSFSQRVWGYQLCRLDLKILFVLLNYWFRSKRQMTTQLSKIVL